MRGLALEIARAFGPRHLRRFLFRRGGVLLPIVPLWIGLHLSTEASKTAVVPPGPRLLAPETFDLSEGDPLPFRAIDPSGNLVPILQEMPDGERRWALYNPRESRAILYATEWPAPVEEPIRGLLANGACVLRAVGPRTSELRSMWTTRDGRRLIVAFEGWDSDPTLRRYGPAVRIVEIDLASGRIERERIFDRIAKLSALEPDDRHIVGLGSDLLGSNLNPTVPVRIDLETGSVARAPVQAVRVFPLSGDRAFVFDWGGGYVWDWNAGSAAETILGPFDDDNPAWFHQIYALDYDPRTGDIFVPVLRRDRLPGEECCWGDEHHPALVRIAQNGAATESPLRFPDWIVSKNRPLFSPGRWRPAAGLWLWGAEGDYPWPTASALVDLNTGNVYRIEEADRAANGRLSPPRDLRFVDDRTIAATPPFGETTGVGFYDVESFLDPNRRTDERLGETNEDRAP